MAYERKELSLHTRIVLPVDSFKYKIFPDNVMNKYLVTTVGKIKFNEILPDTFQYVNESTTENIEKIIPSKFFINKGEDIKAKIKEMPVTKPFAKGDLEKIIAQVFKRYKTTDTSIFLDKLKDLGFKYSTIAGITIAISDIVTSKDKPEILAEGKETVDKINKQFQRGLILLRLMP